MLIRSPYIFQGKKDGLLYCMLNKEIYTYEKELYSLYNFSENPITYSTLCSQFDKNIIKYAIEHKIILDQDRMWFENRIDCFEIQTTTVCNFSCLFCPVHSKPRKKEIMPLKTYENIVFKILRYPYSKMVTFDFYNEPTIDKLFVDRLKILKGTRLKLKLNTNASGINNILLKEIVDSNVVGRININIPSLDQEYYSKLTNFTNLKIILRNIADLIETGIDIGIIVNGNIKENKKHYEILMKKYGKSPNVTVYNNITHNRAGNVENITGTYLKNRGCELFLHNMIIGIDGTIPLCCMDYKRQYVLGNILNREIEDILRSKRYVKEKMKIFQVEDADDDYLCRKCFLTYLSKFVFM